MASAKQRGEKIMVFGTDEFLDFQFLSPPENELLKKAEAIIFSDDPDGSDEVIFSPAKHCIPRYISREEFDEITGTELSGPEYSQLKFMFACFIYQALGGKEL